MQGVNYCDWANSGAGDKFALSERAYLELLRIKQVIGGPRDDEVIKQARSGHH